VTIANRPSVGQDGGISAPDLPDMLSEIFLQKGLDSESGNARRANQNNPTHVRQNPR
jgi:hypothetical protein